MRHNGEPSKPTEVSTAAPLVSIIMPCYNAADYVGAAIESALGQTWSNIEVIVVDDGSTDSSLDVLAGFSDPRLIVVRQRNRGASAARNRALQEARGDYFQFFDADDIMHPEKIATQMRVGEANQQAVTWCHWQPFRAQPGDMRFQVESAQLDMTSREYLQLYLEERCNIPHVCHLIPRAVAERAGSWDESLSVNDDGEYAARIVAASRGLKHVGEGPLYFYRKRVGSLSNINSGSRLHSAMLALDKIAALGEKYGVELKQTRLAWKYYSLMVSSYPHSAPHLAELEQRIQRCGRRGLKPHLGGPAINCFAVIVGWKAARRLQITLKRLAL